MTRRRLSLATLAITLFAGHALAQPFTPPPAPPFTPPPPPPADELRLVQDFTTLFISCGTPVTPTCPNTLTPLEHPLRLHYITLGGRSTTNCSAWLYVARTTPEGEVRTELMRLVLVAGAMDNLAITFPKPIRLEAGDVIGLAVAQGTCAALADLGVEFVE